MVTELHNESSKVGLKMNKNETRSMFINTVPTNIRIDCETLETVDHYVYLGQLVDVKGGQ